MNASVDEQARAVSTPPAGSGTRSLSLGGPRLATSAVVVVFGGFALNTFVNVLAGSATSRVVVSPTTAALTGALALAGLLALQFGVISHPEAIRRSPRALGAVVAQAVLTVVPWWWFGAFWVAMLGFLAGSALWTVGGRIGWALYGVVVVLAGTLAAGAPAEPLDGPYFAFLAAEVGLIVYGLSAIRRLLPELARTRHELAEIAVVRARLRFARELDELLNERLSAISLRCELAARLISDGADRAPDAMRTVGDSAREALRDVRTAVSGYRRTTVADAVAGARAALDDARIEVSASVDDRPLAAERTAILVAALQVGVEDVLRQERARECRLRVRRTPGLVRLEVGSDGAPPPPSAAALDLLERLATEGGSAAFAGGDRYELVVELPLPTDDDSPANVAREPDQRWTPHSLVSGLTEPGRALALLVAVLVGFYLNGIVFVLLRLEGVLPVTVALVCLTGILALQLVTVDHRRLRRRRLVALLIQACLSAVPVVVLGAPETGLVGVVAGGVLVLVRRPLQVPLFVAIVVGIGAAHLVVGAGLLGLTYGMISVLDQGFVVYALVGVHQIVQRLVAARSDLARLSVAKERERFARDVHDLLGYTLSAMALKSDLAARLAPAAGGRARAEALEVLDLTRRALADVRSRSTTFRALALDDEIRSVSSVLRAADVTVTTTLDTDGLPGDVAAVLAVVLRESATNLLRHSHPASCSIVLEQRDGLAVLEIENDGVPAGGAPPSGGAGLANLGNRVGAVGGTLIAGPTAGATYRVAVSIPLERATT